MIAKFNLTKVLTILTFLNNILTIFTCFIQKNSWQWASWLGKGAKKHRH